MCSALRERWRGSVKFSESRSQSVCYRGGQCDMLSAKCPWFVVVLSWQNTRQARTLFYRVHKRVLLENWVSRTYCIVSLLRTYFGYLYFNERSDHGSRYYMCFVLFLIVVFLTLYEYWRKELVISVLLF